MFSILHISDLHRSRDEPVDNDSLVAALLADWDRYAGETPRVPFPEAIVVSGDLIQGARIGAASWQQSMKDQYEIANQFLTALCNRFLGGDRRRMVLIPGNHDVCWNTSRSAMERVSTSDYPKDLYFALVEPDSPLRWSWPEQALYRIKDATAYAQRMDYYWDFAEAFYKDVKLPIPISRSRGFQLFELCDQRIIVAAFDSIVGNDCFGYSGAIPRGAVGQCAIALRDAARSYDLRMAVWHHSIQGPPIRADYMDASQVQEMIGHGFQLGLHGHQHIAATQTQLVHLDKGRSMAVVSAGSLCAGARELPRGVNRQYNLIVLEDDFLHGRVHVREMGEGEQFSRKRNGAFLDGFVDIAWQAKTDVMGRKVDAQAENARRAIMSAETALRERKPNAAVHALQSVDTATLGYARKLMIDALLAIPDWSGLVTLLHTPETIEESVILVSALIEAGDLVGAQIGLDAAAGADNGTRSGLQARIDAKKLMRPT
ncbi:metallophosphoesterase [Bradyrhizobium sp. 188]|uniref:metallophosphoesterase family protein n=1 Tax=Bradyrhizobium sp. 188 TaxID=2782656 RepID=UPI001FF7924F|nr:metallophosphoesterase [Bradyrhizobium sp. 188]MCK1496080.1 metallophosphoesterase [Bradyrhizobium sp. 188]